MVGRGFGGVGGRGCTLLTVVVDLVVAAVATACCIRVAVANRYKSILFLMVTVVDVFVGKRADN